MIKNKLEKNYRIIIEDLFHFGPSYVLQVQKRFLFFKYWAKICSVEIFGKEKPIDFLKEKANNHYSQYMHELIKLAEFNSLKKTMYEFKLSEPIYEEKVQNLIKQENIQLWKKFCDIFS